MFIDGRNLHMELEVMTGEKESIDILSKFIENIGDDDPAMVYIDGNGQFYFIADCHWKIHDFCERSGFLLADMTLYNHKYRIGWGVHQLGMVKCFISGNAFSDAEYETLFDALRFTFLWRKLSLFYPGARRFKHKFKIGTSTCYALYDYIPKSRKLDESVEDRMVKNLVFKFKDGKMPALMAKLLSLAAAEVEDMIPHPEKTILVPIPASTTEGNDKRFREFCRILADSLGVENGFDYIVPSIEREPNAIRKGMPLANAIQMPDSSRFAGKHVVVVDDVITRGEQFSQIATYIRSADARSVTGLFVAKTPEPGEKQKEKLS